MINFFKRKTSTLKLRSKLTFFSLIIAIIPLLFSAFISLMLFITYNSEENKMKLEDKLNTAFLIFEKKQEAIEKTVKNQAGENLVKLNTELMLYSHIKQNFKSIVNSNELSFLALLNDKGEIIVSANSKNSDLEKTKIFNRDFNSYKNKKTFVALIDSEEFLNSEGFTKNINKGLVAMVSIAPVYSYNDQIIAYVIGGYAPEKNKKLLNESKKHINAEILIKSGSEIIASSQNKSDIIFTDKSSYENVLINKEKYNFIYRDARYIFNINSVEFGIGISLKRFYNFQLHIFIIFILIFFISITISFITAYMMSDRITTPIRSMAKASQEIVKGNFSNEISFNSQDEIGVLANNFNYMNKELERVMEELRQEVEEHQEAEEQIKALNNCLEERVKSRTTELKESLSKLRSAQNQLVESEKMASLGQLVAGVAHELNTPIGISITSVSFLKEEFNKLIKAYKNDELDEDHFKDFTNIMEKSLNIICSNLDKASALTKSFKLVSVDQSSENLRSFDLKEYIEEVLLSLSPKLKKGRHKIKFNSDSELHLKSYPGAFYQIISNLVINSLIHGFESMQNGLIEIDLKKENSYIHITYKDNGKGIKKEFLKKIFDPFFTSKRGAGGSGLGLHIVYNIVVQKLKGTLECQSEENKGVLFLIKIPFE